MNKKLKILHVINSMSSSDGGPAYTTLLTLKGTRAVGLDVEVLTNESVPGKEPISDDPAIRYLPRPIISDNYWKYTKVFSRGLSEIEGVDIYHIQGLWLYSGYITARHAQRQGLPYIITLHGTLHPKALAHSSLLKKTALFLYQRRQLEQAACIHVTCKEEMDAYRSLGLTNPVAVIPNPIVCHDVEKPVFADRVKRVGFLGRLYEYKHPERLLEVWSRLDEPGELLIMGDGEQEFVSFLKREITRLKLSRVRLIGWVSGKEKNSLLASLTCLVVPSDFENFGMIVPEALLQEVPVIASTGSPWEILETYGCGRWVNNDTDTLTKTIQDLLDLDQKTLHDMGQKGRKLVVEKYTLEAVSLQMKQMYNWIFGERDKPDFIYE